MKDKDLPMGKDSHMRNIMVTNFIAIKEHDH